MVGNRNKHQIHLCCSLRSNTDTKNWYRGDLKCLLNCPAAPLRVKQDIMHITWKLLRFVLNTRHLFNTAWSLVVKSSMHFDIKKPLLFCQWKSLILSFMIKATGAFSIMHWAKIGLSQASRVHTWFFYMHIGKCYKLQSLCHCFNLLFTSWLHIF